MSRRATTCLAVALAAAALAGCGDDGAATGAGGDGGAGGSLAGPSTTTVASTGSAVPTGAGGGEPASCGPAFGFPPSEECNACASASCCDEVAACAAVPRCAEPAACAEACGDDFACIDACAVQYWGDTPQGIDAIACQREHCAEVCGLEPRDCGYVYAPPDAADRAACQSCMTDECCDAFADQMDPELLAWIQCAIRCTDALCLRECEVAHPEGLPRMEALQRCVIGTCGSSCMPGTETSICGAFSHEDETCASCNRDSCCAAHEACTFDLSCSSFHVCISGCSDVSSCRSCYEAWPLESAGRALAMHACSSVSCLDACPGFPSCGTPPRLLAPPCEACLVDSCCDELGACTTDADCAALLVCTTLCDGDAACEATCAEAHPGGEASRAALAACQDAACAEDCR